MKKVDYITKEYLKELQTENMQFMTDLTSGFNEKVKGIGDQVQALDEKFTVKIDVLSSKVDTLSSKVDALSRDVTQIKDVLTEKVDKKDFQKHGKRIAKLEHALAE